MERNITLDYYKVFLALLVITIHMGWLTGVGSVSSWIISDGFARIGVPSFFIISGYFLAYKMNRIESLKKYLIHLVSIYVIWEIIYLPLYLGRSIMLFDIFVGYYHLWFVMALLIGCILMILLKKVIKNDIIIVFIGLGLYLAANMFLKNNYEIAFSHKIGYFQNGIFIGFPFVALGYIINTRKIVTLLGKWVTLILTTIALIVLVYDIFYTRSHLYTPTFMLSLWFACPIFFICVLKFSKQIKTDSAYYYYLSKVSASIYFVHIYVINCIVGLSVNGNIYRYPIVVTISTILGILVITVNKRIKILL